MFSFLFFLHSAQIHSLTKVVYGKIGNPTFCPAFIQLGYIFEASYSTSSTWVSKTSSVNQSELEK